MPGKEFGQFRAAALGPVTGFQSKRHGRDDLAWHGAQPVFRQFAQHRIGEGMHEGSLLDKGIGDEFGVPFPAHADVAQHGGVMLIDRLWDRQTIVLKQTEQMLDIATAAPLATDRGDMRDTLGGMQRLVRASMQLGDDLMT